MAQNDNTAERELLKTIEGKADLNKKLNKTGGSSYVSLIKSQFSFLSDNFKGKFSSDVVRVTPHQINRGLWVLIFVLLGWYFFVFMSGMDRLNNIPRFEVSPGRAVFEVVDSVKLPLKDYAYYTSITLGRNIFNPVEQEEVEVKPQVTQTSEMVKELRVVGISWSENKTERFVMIEDTKVNITYFLQEGDKIGDFTVDTILKEKALLKIGEEEIELR